jgi:hypothetical protein
MILAFLLILVVVLLVVCIGGAMFCSLNPTTKGGCPDTPSIDAVRTSTSCLAIAQGGEHRLLINDYEKMCARV